MANLRSINRKLLGFILRRFWISTAVLVLVILGAGYAYVVSPQLMAVRAVGVQGLAAKEQERNEKQQLVDRLRQSREQFREVTAAEVERLSRILPAERDLPGLFLQVQELAADAQLRVTSVEVSEQGALATTGAPDGKPNAIQKLNVAVQVEGFRSYDQFKAFLDLLERNMRLFDISSLSYTPGTTSYAVNLTTYYASQK